MSAHIPEAVKWVLHARVARWLEETSAHPAVVARQWLDSGRGARAEPWLIEAARQAESGALNREATDASRRAGEILESLGDADQAAELRSRVATLQAQGGVGS